ncbi:hypothetical protein L596_015583 [Steinernema carpocapsae]|uniref:Uncharacterized protein n=1 Tax=Steinernema carpocapsae TaxID=34508 RepID=A0A4U5NGE9_STECR|nr:hypothetical protein L596_015583 [Steinernema carpocapsae]
MTLGRRRRGRSCGRRAREGKLCVEMYLRAKETRKANRGEQIKIDAPKLASWYILRSKRKVSSQSRT